MSIFVLHAGIMQAEAITGKVQSNLTVTICFIFHLSPSLDIYIVGKKVCCEAAVKNRVLHDCIYSRLFALVCISTVALLLAKLMMIRWMNESVKRRSIDRAGVSSDSDMRACRSEKWRKGEVGEGEGRDCIESDAIHKEWTKKAKEINSCAMYLWL